MTTQLITDSQRPVEALDELITRHGVLHIVLALPAAVLKRRAAPLRDHELSEHLRRDIGLTGGPQKDWR